MTVSLASAHRRLSAIDAALPLAPAVSCRDELLFRVETIRQLLTEMEQSPGPAIMNRLLFELDRTECLLNAPGEAHLRIPQDAFPPLRYVFISRIFSMLNRMRGVLLVYRPMEYHPSSFTLGSVIFERIAASRWYTSLRLLVSRLR